MTNQILQKDSASFRDPSGFVYYQKNHVYRRIKPCYFKQYKYFMESGLYDKLRSEHLIIEHEEIEATKDYITIKAKKIPYLSYPYEWCFKAFKDAALLTLKILKLSLDYGMILKDASVYNVQFIGKNCIFIDTLSFDFYEEGKPWGAYGQFTRHFLAPLLLMGYVDEELNALLKHYMDGIPLDLACNILKSRGGAAAKIHLKMQQKAILKNRDKKESLKKAKLSKKGLYNIIAMLEQEIMGLKEKKGESEWNNYYDHTNYTVRAMKEKERIIKDYFSMIQGKKNDLVFDLGGNDGTFSQIAADFGYYTVCFDSDKNAIQFCYEEQKNKENLLPLRMDIINPTPAIGFSLMERKSFMERGNAKCVMALAFLHHLAISNNVPFDRIAEFFSKLGEYLIIEFIPKEDSQVKKLLETRKDIFPFYKEENFEKEFSKFFQIIKKEPIKESMRILYFMKVYNEKK